MREIAGRYEVGVPLGRGGMSQVHEGVDLRLNRPVAIKLVRADITLGAQLCAALAAAHAEGLVHRDIKPSNVMVARTGLLKLVDFGVAAALDPADYSRITAAGEAPGTFGYRPPEILSGGEVTPAGDLYAVGCLLYEMLTGQPVFDARSPFDAMELHRSTMPPPVTEERPDVPDAFARLIDELLAKDPAARPQTALDTGLKLL